MRCNWVSSDLDYIKYHDEEWGVASFDDRYLFEMLVLESFHCGLSWLIILKKRNNFKKVFDNFDVHKVSTYNETKIEQLLSDSSIVKHKGKIEATINNAKCFIEVQKEFGSFSNYIWGFTNNKVVYRSVVVTKNELSDKVSKDLKKRGFKFMGSVTTYSYLEAIGVMNNHQECCFKNKDKDCI